MVDVNNLKYRVNFFISEFLGTALLVAGGLSAVIFMFGYGSPMEQLIPDVMTRQIITGFLFGSVGASIALSPIGKVSGAHINPAVTMIFWLFRKIEGRLAITYILAQLTGAIAGCLPLLFWGGMGRSVAFGATLPGEGYSTLTVIMGEVITTFTMVSLLIIFIGFRKIRAYTPAIFPVLYAIMVPLESAISGTSTNPARSIGPSVISGLWDGWWIYWIGPLAGAFLASVACSFLARRITIAKLYYFDGESKGDALLRRKVQTDL
ncbi:MAG: aquaporin [Bacteroidales bacterium]|nr:aquaporin [Bacteroidales bacterium]